MTSYNREGPAGDPVAPARATADDSSMEENLGIGLGVVAGAAAGAAAGPLGMVVGAALGSIIGDIAGSALHEDAAACGDSGERRRLEGRVDEAGCAKLAGRCLSAGRAR